MNAQVIYSKTDKGKGEVANRSDALSMRTRRVLILVNGATSAAEIQRKALIEDIDAELRHLESGGYIRMAEEHEDVTVRDPELTVNIAEAREFMTNTLLTFGNRGRVDGLVEQIQATEEALALRDLVTPWYQAISETPSGLYQADHLKQDLTKMLG